MSYQVQDIISREVCHIREGYHIKGGVSYQDRDVISREGGHIKTGMPYQERDALSSTPFPC